MKRHPYRLNFIWINRRGVWWRKTKSNASLTLVENGRHSWGTGVLDVVVCALHSVKSLLQVCPATSQYSCCILSRPGLQHSHSPKLGTWTAGGFFFFKGILRAQCYTLCRYAPKIIIHCFGGRT